MTSSNQNQKPSIPSQMLPSPLKKALSDLKNKQVCFSQAQNKKKSFSLIDLGCGQGDLLYLLKKENYLKGAKVIGLDINKKSIQTFKKRMPGTKAIIADASNLKMLENRSFDFVICNQVVEHVDNDNLLLSEINRILKNGGHLYISSVLKKWYGLYWHRNKFGQIVVDPTHVREYASSEEFKNLLTGHGFSIQNLNISPGSFPLVDYILLFLARISFLKFVNLKYYYLDHPRIYQISKKVLLPMPGYASIEAIAEKK